jgi:hypothetical protein
MKKVINVHDRKGTLSQIISESALTTILLGGWVHRIRVLRFGIN